MNWIKKMSKNKWIFNVACSILASGIVGGVVWLCNSVGVANVFKVVLSGIWTMLLYKLPIYVFVIIILGMICIVRIYGAILKKQGQSNARSQPQWIDYKNRMHKEWMMKWEYEYNSYIGKYEIENIRPVCVCGCELSFKYEYMDGQRRHIRTSAGVLVCPKCNQVYPRIDEEDVLDFKKVLIYDLNNNLYQNKKM